MRNGLILAILVLAGCQDGGTVQATAPEADASAPPVAAALPVALRVEHDGPVFGRRGPLRAIVTQLDSGATRAIELAPRGVPEDASYQLELAPGRYTFQVFYDRDDDGALTDCPFPPSPGDTAAADSYDNVQGEVDAQLSEGGEVVVQLARRLCGPGDPTTGLSGAVRAPAGVDLTRQPVLLRVEPMFDPAGAPGDNDLIYAPTRLELPLFPNGFEAVGQFSVGELVPGTYRLTFFADADGDGRPWPCGDGVGGADRYLGVLDEPIEVRAGERAALPRDVVLAVDPSCPDELTGVTLDLTLPPDLKPDPALGALRFALISPNGGEPAINIELNPTWVEPAHYTITGLPPGTWRAAAWFDQDRDGEFIPCGGLEAGLDSIYGIAEDIRVRAGQLSQLAPLALSRAECGDQPMALVTGRLWFPSEMGPEGSGRPVRLTLMPVDDGGERRDVLLFENHRGGHATPATFTRGINAPPGRYQARVYLDGDRDGDFSSCLVDPYGDRATSEVFDLNVADGPMIDLGEHSLTVEDCAVPPASVRPRIRVEPSSLALLAGGASALRLQIAEVGGWSSDRPLSRPDELLEAGFDGPMVRLAPGHYQITVYLDSQANEQLDSCEAEAFDAVVGRVEVNLTAQSPEQTPTVTLEPACGR